MSEHVAEQVGLQETRRIPAPDPDREPLKANVFVSMAKAASQLTPLFPYDHAGSIVPCGAVLIGGPDNEYGHFFHWNAVNEVAITYGSNEAMLATGQIMATQHLHGVNSFLRDEKNPQTEALIARCRNCKEELVRYDYDSTPFPLPRYDAARYGESDSPVRQFPTTLGSIEFVDRRNSEQGRTCRSCRHVNDPFPAEIWGWARTVIQTHAVTRAHHALREAASAQHEQEKARADSAIRRTR
ncbi:hypothetical protein ACFOZ0_30295 [Streptomyces yaanensis]|uniref:Uncharacterized protein n=1 Tax=Streptomyces yaanensis TaxID=1142239 RepID=A0ABV7SMX9_9ACTN|nr:hypothetical protein [Streptomyces sp. CGMCC 4.7035]WNC00381.1 hypothetical protein Q2K21_21250 [Streptomyces sp. CGMCC 4.7035]